MLVGWWKSHYFCFVFLPEWAIRRARSVCPKGMPSLSFYQMPLTCIEQFGFHVQTCSKMFKHLEAPETWEVHSQSISIYQPSLLLHPRNPRAMWSLPQFLVSWLTMLTVTSNSLTQSHATSELLAENVKPPVCLVGAPLFGAWNHDSWGHVTPRGFVFVFGWGFVFCSDKPSVFGNTLPINHILIMSPLYPQYISSYSVGYPFSHFHSFSSLGPHIPWSSKLPVTQRIVGQKRGTNGPTDHLPLLSTINRVKRLLFFSSRSQDFFHPCKWLKWNQSISKSQPNTWFSFGTQV